MAVFLVLSLPKIPYTHRIYMVLANPTHFVDGAITFEGVADNEPCK